MSTSSSHLGDIAAALADGQLDHDDRDRALVHIMWCDACRRDVERQRRTKALVAGLIEPRCPDDLFLRLAALPRMSADETFALMQSSMATPQPPRVDARSGRRPAPHRSSRRRFSAALVGSASVIAFGVWATPGESTGFSPELVNAGGHPSSAYETVDFSRPSRVTRFGQLPAGFGFLGRP